MSILDEIRKKAETEAKGEAVFMSDAPKKVRLSDFTKEDPQFVQLLDDAQRRADSFGRIPQKRTGYWASEALSPCLRKMWLSWKALPTDSAANLDTFALGNSIEDAVVKKFQSAGIVLRQQESVSIFDLRLTKPITGRIDLLILESNDVIVPVECKSTKDWGEDYGYEKWKGFLPKEEHAAQLTLYLKARGADHGFVVYFNKNRSLLAIYRVDFNQDFYDFIIEEFAKFERALDGVEPEIPDGFTGNRFPCGWQSRAPDAKAAGKLEGTCPFWSHCYKGKKLEMIE